MSTTATLTDSQRQYLGAIIGVVGGVTTASLAKTFDASPDAANKVMRRMEKRNLVGGAGKGTGRVWHATEEGKRLHGAGEGAEESTLRAYRVFEETTLDEVVRRVIEDEGKSLAGSGKEVAVREKWLDELLSILGAHEGWSLVTQCDGRNTEHALRQGGRTYEDDLMREEVTLVAVPERNWKPTKVRLGTRRTVSVG